MNTFVVAKREFRAIFVWPTIYFVATLFLFITGLNFFATVALRNVTSLAQVFYSISILLLIVAPILTMRLLSEETRSGTLELLLTSPVRDWEVVVGKFLAAYLFFIVMLIPTLYYLFLLMYYGKPEIPVIFSGYLGLILLGTMLTGLGVLASALSSNQIVAAVLGIVFISFFWLVGGVGTAVDGLFGDVLVYLSIQEHFTDFLLGLITTNNIVYFLSVTVGSLFVATRILEVRRCW
jgi:ABC-2 type transport system permease protein